MAKEDDLKRNTKDLNKTNKKSSRVSTVKTETSKKRTRRAVEEPTPLLFSKENYIIIGVGLFVVIVGMFLMSGGQNASDEWIADEIYSFRRITLAPFVVLLGLAVVVLAIFKSPKEHTPINLNTGTDSNA
jgi:hypothetical protein